MFCSNCGRQLDDSARFCPGCGAKTAGAPMGADSVPTVQHEQIPAPAIPAGGQRVTENIVLCPDGVYRWVYEYNMLKNPTIFLMILKIFGCIIGGVFLFDIILMLADGDLSAESFFDTAKIFALLFLGFTVLAFISYLIVAARNGWKYIVLFEMDENGVTHTQMQKQFEKAQALGWLTAMAGLLSGNPTLAGAGINSAVHDSISSEFSKVRNIKVMRHRGVIKVNEMLFKNQVYAEKADFDFVLDYIRSRIPR